MFLTSIVANVLARSGSLFVAVGSKWLVVAHSVVEVAHAVAHSTV